MSAIWAIAAGPARKHETRNQIELKNPLEIYVGYHLRRATATMIADLSKRIKHLNITVTEMSVLLLIEANPDIIQSEIGRTLSIQRANLTPLTGHLLKRKLISRQPVNGRSHGLRLTQSGVALLAEARGHIAANEAWTLSSLSAGESETLLALLGKVWSSEL